MRLLCCCCFFFFSWHKWVSAWSHTSLHHTERSNRPPGRLSLVLFLHKGQLDKQRGVTPQLCLKDHLKRAGDFLFFMFGLAFIPFLIFTRLVRSQRVMWQQQRNLQLQTRAKWTPKLFAAFIQLFFSPPDEASCHKQGKKNKKRKLLICDLTAWARTASCQRTRRGLIVPLTAKLPEYYPNIRRGLIIWIIWRRSKQSET